VPNSDLYRKRALIWICEGGYEVAFEGKVKYVIPLLVHSLWNRLHRLIVASDVDALARPQVLTEWLVGKGC
jgi:hypothetical protein